MIEKFYFPFQLEIIKKEEAFIKEVDRLVHRVATASFNGSGRNQMPSQIKSPLLLNFGEFL